MATGTDLSCNKERINYLRLCRALIDLGSQVLRDILSQNISPNNLNQAVKSSNLKLYQEQRQQLCTVKQFGYTQLDISLLYSLIRGLCKNIKPTRGWNPSSPPSPTEITLGDDVERIRFLRNYIYGHIHETKVSEKIFEQHWEELENVMTRMDKIFGSDYKNSLLTIEIDSMVEDTIRKQHLKDRNQETVRNWEKDIVTFTSTKAAKHARLEVNENKVTLITGPPGSGKSAIAHNIAISLQGEDYLIVPVESIQDLQHSWVRDCKQVFVFDDVFGVHKLDDVEIGNWYKRIKKIEVLLEKSKMIISMRKHLSSDQNLLSIFSEIKHSVVDITRNDLVLSKHEKEQIFLKHLSSVKKRAFCNESVRNCTLSCFPLLCKLFAADSESKHDLKLFFTQPLSLLKKEIEFFRKNKDIRYLCLILCVVNDNRLSDNLFNMEDETKDIKQMRKDFAECCGFSRFLSRVDIKSHSESLLGTYLHKEDGHYKFIHDILYDVVLSTLTKQFHPLIIKHCSSKFIYQRVVLSSMLSVKDDIFPYIVLKDSFKEAWVNRLIKDVNMGKYFDVFLNKCLQDGIVKELFFNNFKTNCALTKHNFQDVIQLSKADFEELYPRIVHTSKNTLKAKLDIVAISYMSSIKLTPVHLIVANNMNKIFFYILDMFSSQEKQNLLCSDTLMNVAALHGNKAVFEYILDSYPDIQYSFNENIHPLVLSSAGGHIELVQVIFRSFTKIENSIKSDALIAASIIGHDSTVQVLLDKGADIDEVNNDVNTALHHASYNGHGSTVQLLLDNGADIEKVDNDGRTALHIASYKGHDSTVQILLNKGADIEKVDNEGSTALHHASYNGQDSTVQLLLNKGADIDKVDNDGRTALHKASYNGHDSTVQLLLNKGADIDKVDNDGRTALHDASYNGHDSTVQLLLNKGADIDKVDNDGSTALHDASCNGHGSTVQILLDKVSDIDEVDNNRRTALHLASYNGHDSTVQLLLNMGADIDKVDKDGTTALHKASYNGHDSTVQVLLDKGADIGKVDKDSTTALHKASYNGHDSTVQVLLDKGADIDNVNKDGWTALHKASYNGHDSTVQVLLDKGADIDKVDNGGSTALHNASYNGHDSTVQILLDKGADIDKVDNGGSTALHKASYNGHDSTVQVLIDKGADIDKVDNNGSTELHKASYNGHDSTVQLLLNKGADIDKVDNDGRTALHHASYNGHDSTVQLLLNKGADIDKVDNNGRTALHKASYKRHANTVQILLDKGAYVNNDSNKNRCNCCIL